MTRLTFITGLPGSGKSRRAKELASEKEAVIFDDYKSKSRDNNPAFWMSPKYEELIDTLKKGKDCIVTDVDFYELASYREATTHLETLLGDQIDTNWEFFEKNVEGCVRNVCQRAYNGADEERKRSLDGIGVIFAYAVVGTVPDGLPTRPVQSADDPPKIPRDAFSEEQLYRVIDSLHRNFAELKLAHDSKSLDSANALATLGLVLRSFSDQFGDA